MTDECKEYLVGSVEARKLINKAARDKKHLFVRGGSFLITIETEEGKRGFDNSCTIAVSKRAALKYLEEIFPAVYEAKGAKIKLVDLGICFFIG